MEGQGKFGEQRPPRETEVASTLGAQGLDDAALDLVYAATSEGDDGVVRTLLRSLVALELTSAASYWSATGTPDSPTGMIWTQRRGFGGATPAPEFEGSGLGAAASLSFRLGSSGAVVALRETFDADGRGEQRVDELESLVHLADTLLQESHDYPSSHTRKTEVHRETPGPLPKPLPEMRKGRQGS